MHGGESLWPEKTRGMHTVQNFYAASRTEAAELAEKIREAINFS